MKKTGMLIIALLLCLAAQAQEKKLVRKGNELYQQKRYKEAAATYQQALQKNPGYIPGSFNLGNSLIQQGQLEAARKIMTATARQAKGREEQAGANYNIGNTYMAEQKWSEAVAAYKQALRKNPQDAAAKYNLSYALAKLKQNQNGGGGKDKNKDKNSQDKKDQHKDNKDDKKEDKDQQQQNKDQQDNKDKQQDNKEDKEGRKEQQRPQPQPSKLSQQQADNLLNALQQDERKLQDKMQKGKGVPMKMDKDW